MIRFFPIVINQYYDSKNTNDIFVKVSQNDAQSGYLKDKLHNIDASIVLSDNTSELNITVGLIDCGEWN